jgi:hypothetical protein
MCQDVNENIYVTNVPNYSPKIEKMKIEDFFGRKLFYPTVAGFFINKTEALNSLED